MLTYEYFDYYYLLFIEINKEVIYFKVYQMLSKMADNVESMFSQIIDSMDIDERLRNIVSQPRIKVSPVNSDFID